MTPNKQSRKILVTGATAGIGEAFVKLCIENGDDVCILSRTPVTSFENISRNILCDMSHPATLGQAINQIEGEIDLVVNFAGVMLAKCLAEAELEDIQETMNVNIITPMHLITLVLPRMAKDSLIMMIGSQSAYKGSYDDLYAISKAAIHGLVGTLAPKLAPDIRIINVAPGIATGTRMTDRRSDEDLARAAERVPLKRLTSANEVAKACFDLSGETFCYMTGNTVDLNGGNYIR